MKTDWKKKREDYIEKVRDEYKVKENRPMTEKKYKCPWCNQEHEIDKYGWVQSCFGYFDLNNIEHEYEKFIERMANVGKNK